MKSFRQFITEIMSVSASGGAGGGGDGDAKSRVDQQGPAKPLGDRWWLNPDQYREWKPKPRKPRPKPKDDPRRQRYWDNQYRKLANAWRRYDCGGAGAGSARCGNIEDRMREQERQAQGEGWKYGPVPPI